MLLGFIAACGLSLVCYVGVMLCVPTFGASDGILQFLALSLPEWPAFLSVLLVLVFSLVYWRRESWFWRIFTPAVYAALAIYWIVVVCFVDPGMAGQHILLNLQSGSIDYVYYHTIPVLMYAAVFTAIAEAVKREMARHTEKKLLEEHRKLSMISYENMRCQHEEVMKLRHDMNRHFQALQKMASEETVKEYLNDLIGKDREIHPVVQIENRTLEIILNSKIQSAIKSGIKVDIIRMEAPEELPLTNADLCSLVMNILDNAITAAAASGMEQPNIQIDLHIKGNFFSLFCANSADIRQIEKVPGNEILPKHGFGLKIIQNIVERYEGLIDSEYGEDYYKIWVAIPLT